MTTVDTGISGCRNRHVSRKSPDTFRGLTIGRATPFILCFFLLALHTACALDLGVVTATTPDRKAEIAGNSEWIETGSSRTEEDASGDPGGCAYRRPESWRVSSSLTTTIYYLLVALFLFSVVMTWKNSDHGKSLLSPSFLVEFLRYRFLPTIHALFTNKKLLQSHEPSHPRKGDTLPLAFVSLCSFLLLGSMFALFYKEMVDYGPHTSLFLQHLTYWEDYSNKYPHLPNAPGHVSILYFLVWATMDFTEIVVHLLPASLPVQALVHRVLMLALNTSASFVIYRIAKRRLANNWAAAFISLTPVLMPYLFMKAAAGQLSVNLFFVALAFDAWDQKKHRLFIFYLLLFDFVHPINMANGLMWTFLLYHCGDFHFRQKLKTVLGLQVFLTIGLVAVGTYLYFRVPSDMFGSSVIDKTLQFLSTISLSNLPHVILDFEKPLMEIFTIFLVFLFLPLNLYLLLIVVFDLLLFLFASELLHGSITSFIGFVCLASINGIAVVTRNEPDERSRGRLQTGLALLILCLSAGYSLSANWQDINPPRILYKTIAASEVNSPHTRTIDRCLNQIPPDSYCIASRNITPYMEDIRKTVDLDSFVFFLGSSASSAFSCSSCESKKNTDMGSVQKEMCQRAFGEQPNCIFLDLEQYRIGNRIGFIPDFRPQLDIWLDVISKSTPVPAEKVDQQVLDRISEVLLDLSACGLDERIVEKLRMKEDLACNEDNIVLLLDDR